jgi:thioredoxin-disulfide reductase
MKNEGEIYDIVIIGGGPAGLTAAIYAVRSGLKILLVAKNLGGTTNSILELENWPGYHGTGYDLMKSFYEHLRNLKGAAEVVLEDVSKIEKKGKNFIVKTEMKEVETKTIILATGAIKEGLKISGEEKFKGKGVSYCTTCDGFFFRGKDVAVIGKEENMRDSVFELSKIARKVYVIYWGKKLHFEKEFEKNEKVEFIYNAVPGEISGNEKVESLKIKDKKGEREIKVDGIFIEVGATPLTEFVKNLRVKRDRDGFIILNENMETSVKGIFAAGDVINSRVKSVLTSASQGAIAAKMAEEYLE